MNRAISNETRCDTSAQQIEVGQIKQRCVAVEHRCTVLGCVGMDAPAETRATRVLRPAISAAATAPTDRRPLSNSINDLPKTVGIAVVLHRVAFRVGAPKRVCIEFTTTTR